MNATTLNCHSCGAAVTGSDPTCGHCGARLATLACPACFAMMFRDSRFCPSCGSPAAQWSAALSDRQCPGCREPMLEGKLNGIRLHECPKCFGLWLDTATFEQICRDAERQASVLGSARQIPGPLGPVRYRPCPECAELMHRVNFAQCSGVVVDVCRLHGTWFDANELHRIAQFIRAGGLDRSRAREKAELAEEQRRLKAARAAAGPIEADHVPGTDSDDLTAVIEAAGDLLFSWLRHD